MMRKAIRILLLVAIFSLLGVVSYRVGRSIWLQKVREIKENPLELLDFVPEAALQIRDFRRSKIEGGRKVWEVVGEKASYLKAEKEAVVTKPRFTMYDRNGETLEVSGDEGRLFFTDNEMDRMQLRGAVEVSYRGFLLETDEIFFFQDEEQVLSKGKVVVRGDGLEVEGVGMDISLRDEKLQLQNRVKTRLQVDGLKNKGVWPGGKNEN